MPDANVLDTVPPSPSSAENNTTEKKDSTNITEIANQKKNDLDPEILQVLGTDPSKPKNSKIVLQEELQALWSVWLSSQIKREDIEELINEYARESEKFHFEAPKLNPEIAAMSTDALIERDKKFITPQNMTGSTLVSLGSAVSNLIEDDEVDKLELLKKLCDGEKMMTQIQQRQASFSTAQNNQRKSWK